MSYFKEKTSRNQGRNNVHLKLEWYMQRLLQYNLCAQHYILDKAKRLNITLLLNVTSLSLVGGNQDDVQKIQDMLPEWIVKKKIPFEEQWDTEESIVEAVQKHLGRNQKANQAKVFVMMESDGILIIGTDDVIENAVKLVERYLQSLRDTMSAPRTIPRHTTDFSDILYLRDDKVSTGDQSTRDHLLDWRSSIVDSDVVAVVFINGHLSPEVEEFLKDQSQYEEWKKIVSKLLRREEEDMKSESVQPSVVFSASAYENLLFAFLLLPGGKGEVDEQTRESSIGTLLEECTNLYAASVGLIVDVPEDAVETVGKQVVHVCLNNRDLQIKLFWLGEQKTVLNQLAKEADSCYKRKDLETESSIPAQQICLVVDELSRIEADVLVNPVNKYLDITLGGVAKSLNDATKGKLQTALKKAYPKGIKEGTLAITNSCGLRAKEIFHGTLKPFSKKMLGADHKSKSKIKDWEPMKALVQCCLHEVRSHRYKSVAFPVLGCGNLGYPPEEVVHVMFDSVEQFFNKHGQSYAIKVIFVLYPKDKEIIRIFNEEWMARNFGINLKVNQETFISCGRIALQIFCKDFWNSRGKSDGLLCFWNEDQNKHPSNHPIVGADLQNIKWDLYAADLEHGFTATVGGNLPAKFLYHVRTEGPDFERAMMEALSKASMMGCFTLQVPILDEVSNLSWPEFSKMLWKSLLLTEGSLTVVTLLAKEKEAYKTLLGSFQQLHDGTMQSSYSDNLLSAGTSENWSSTCQSPESTLDVEAVKGCKDACDMSEMSKGKIQDVQEEFKEPMSGEEFQEITGFAKVPMSTTNDSFIEKTHEVQEEYKVPMSEEEFQEITGFAKAPTTNDSFIEERNIKSQAAMKYLASEQLFYHTRSGENANQMSQFESMGLPSFKTDQLQDWKSEKLSPLRYTAAQHIIGPQELEKACRIQIRTDDLVIVTFFDTPTAKKIQEKVIGFNCTSVDIPTTKDVSQFLVSLMDDMQNVYAELDQEKKQVHIVSEAWIDLDQAKKKIQNKSSYKKPTSRRNRRFCQISDISDDSLPSDRPLNQSFSQMSEHSQLLDSSSSSRSLSKNSEKLQPFGSSSSKSSVIQRSGSSTAYRSLRESFSQSSEQFDFLPQDPAHMANSPSRSPRLDEEKHSAGAQSHQGQGDTAETKFHFNEDVSVSVIRDNIFKVEANALISWEQRGAMTLSPFQKKLISEGGKIYEDERKKRLEQVRKRIFVPTKSGNLIQGQVLHAFVAMSTNLEDFVPLVTKLFKQCVSWNYTSVCLPVFLNFTSSLEVKEPVYLFMETVVDVLTKLSQDKNGPVLRVIIVDQEGKVVQDLTSALSQYLISLGLAQTSHMNNQEDKDKDCPICLDIITEPERLACGHGFCKECLKAAFESKKACPICGRLYGPIFGTMPEGTMTDKTEGSSLPGFPGCGTIVINYFIPGGTQTEEHPNPGKPFIGAHWRAYLPDTREGRKVLALLRVAWKRRLTFTVSRSVKRVGDDRVTWSEIQHKTHRTGGPSGFGYPDEGYLQRVQEELEHMGITEKDLDSPVY